MRLLFIGESWLGSSARRLKEGLYGYQDILLDEINEDLYFPKPRGRGLRALMRLTYSRYLKEFDAAVLQHVHQFKPDAVVAYKGFPLRLKLVERIRSLGISTINIYPDCPPHAHGEAHKHAVGGYDLVISTKHYHPALWQEVYGYKNRCVFVPHGYDAKLNLYDSYADNHEFDIVMVGTWRPEYGRLMADFARHMGSDPIRVAIGGHGWAARRAELPSHWIFPGSVHGRGYVELLRKGKICIAPLTRDVIINGRRQPGDVDTNRTYELAAACCFFIHRRTDYLQTIYDEATEVPMFEDAAELADLVRHYLTHPVERRRMAEGAHRRAVPAYSMDAKLGTMIELIRAEL